MTHCQLHSYEDYGLLYFHSAILNAWFPFAEPSWFRMAAGAPTVTSIFQTAGRNKSRRAGVCLPTALAPLKWSEVKSLSRVQLFATPWTVAYQAPLSMRFSRQESWSGLPFPSPGDLPNPGIEPGSPALWTDALPSEPPGQSNSIEAGCKSPTWGFHLHFM